MDEFRDDGTVVCPIHGLRYDPAIAGGCIRCPRGSVQPAKKSRAPSRPEIRSSTAPPSLSSRPDRTSAVPSLRPFEPIAPRSAPPIPFEPGMLPTEPLGAPTLSIIAAPPRPSSRRGVVLGVLAVTVGAIGAVGWIYRVQPPPNWASKVKVIKWDSRLGPREGAVYVPSDRAGPFPLVVVCDPSWTLGDAVGRFARHAHRYGYVLASTRSVGHGASPSDGDETQVLIEHVRSITELDSSRVMVAGCDAAAECAYRLAVMEPDVYGGAIAELPNISVWRDIAAFARPGTSFYLFTRTSDPRRELAYTLKDEMEHRGLSVTIVELPGGHEGMSGEDIDGAFQWMNALRA